MNELDEIIQEFLVESHENLDQLDQDLVALEQDPTSRPLLSSIFRTIHTIKGTSGFLAFHQLESVTHVGEGLLSKLRDGELRLDQETTDALLAMVDAVRGILATIEASGAEGDADHSALVERLTALQQPRTAVAEPERPAQPEPAAPPKPKPAKSRSRRKPATTEPTPEPVMEAFAEPVAAPAAPVVSDPQPARLGELLVEQGAASPDDVTIARLEQEVGDPRRIGEILLGQGATTPQELDKALDTQAERRSVADSTIRVDVDLLESLMRLVGELVLTRNQIVARAGVVRDTPLVRATTRLNLIASELQEGVMKTRMQPIDHVWSKLPRVVRDLSAHCGKSVRLEMEGRETELDRTLLEAIKDPLTHLVRNAVDHGIEPTVERVAKGKPADGLLLLRAFHEGGQVNIEIQDDGAGIDPQRIAAKALERGLVTRDQLGRMTDRELVQLVFLPGFSTAPVVTNVSGRGVGMDVVKTNIERIGGTVDITSEVGVGTTFRVKIPLTLAIIPALTVTCAGDRYAIPQVNLVELVRLEGEQARSGVEMISGAPVYRLRGNLLPLVHLDAQLRVGSDETADTLYIVVLQAEDRQFGLIVDDVLDTEEIVVKPLSSQLKAVPAFAGATILGDGRVALILDVLALAQQAHVLTSGGDRSATERLLSREERAEQRESLLVVSCGGDRRMAIPLEMVTRLEEFAAEVIEHVGSREVVQYRGQILPLVRLASLLGAGGGSDDGRVQVVVYSERGRSVGLVVESILDIAEETVAARSDVVDYGLTGSAVVQQRITEMLDVRAAILAADPNFFDAPVETVI